MTQEAGQAELDRQAAEQAKIDARRAAAGTAPECVCGEYDCEYYDCEDYDEEGNLIDDELTQFSRKFNRFQEERNATVEGIENAFACEPDDPTCVPEGEEGIEVCARAKVLPTPLRPDEILSFKANICEYKINCANENELMPYSITLYRDGAAGLATGAAVVAATLSALTL